MEAIFAPMVALENSGIEIECADGKVQLCFPRLVAWIADQDLVYVPVKEWNSEEPPQRVYSEIHTADWWWEAQVGSNATFHRAFIPFIRHKIDGQ